MELLLLAGLLYCALGLIDLFKWYGVAIIVATVIVANQGDNIMNWLNAFFVAGFMSLAGMPFIERLHK